MFRAAASRFALVATILLLPASNASAGLFRAYLASYGSDTNPCTVAAPCRLLPAALAAVSVGGEIWIMDSANFNAGTVTIAQDVSIQAIPGQVGSIASVGGGAAISATTPIILKLRNVAIVNNANSPGTDGVVMAGGGRLEIEDSLISVLNDGVRVDGGVYLSIHRSIVRDSGNGVVVNGSSKADISFTKFSNIGNAGVLVQGTLGSNTALATVSDCTFGNVWIGAYADGFTSGATAKLTVMRSTFATGGYGVASAVSTGSTAIASVGMTSISGMLNTAFFTGSAGSSTESFGNNLVRNNASTGTYVTVAPI